MHEYWRNVASSRLSCNINIFVTKFFSGEVATRLSRFRSIKNLLYVYTEVIQRMCILRVTATISRGIDERLVKINRKSSECELLLPYFLIRLKGHVELTVNIRL